ncbi:hypothetical protein [Phocaeicola sartorii]|uniref:hypothetical protein n=1 Tax=Phocaeicola sartorii TaxID=671267 RepID=UPI003516D616
MRTVFKSWQLIAMSVMMVFATSCEKNNGDDPSPGKVLGGEGNILIATTVKNPDGQSGQSYVQQMPELSGTLSMSKGIQTGFGTPISIVGNDVFVFPEFGGKGTQTIIRYARSQKGLEKAAEMQIIPDSNPSNLTQVSAEKAYIPTYVLGRIMIVNPKTLEKKGEIDLKQYAHHDASPEPAHGILREGLYYLPLNQLAENWMPYADYRQVDVVIIDTKTDQVVKVISEKTSGLCFPTRPFLKEMIFTNEQNDIYIACAGYFGYDPTYLKNGFVCIPAGKQEFDETQTWDISGTSIEGSAYKAASVFNCKYIGHGKVAAYAGIVELNGNNPYTARNAMAVLIDLNSRTIKKIEGIPYTDGYSVAIEYHNGEVFFAAYGIDASGIFAYNPITGKVRQALSASGNIAYMHFFN